MTAFSVMLCFLGAPQDALREHEAAVANATLMNRHPSPVVYAPPNAQPHPYVQQVQVRRFEDRFNKLVRAVEEFSLAYNQSKGQVWPGAKAAALRKAMAELQKADPSMSDKAEDRKPAATAKP
jgi:hypothetical protein